MPRKIVLFSIVLTAVLFCLSLALAQTAKEEKGRAKTMKLPSGEVIYDLNGEWAASIEHYGRWEQYGVFPDIVEIKQEGVSIVEVTLLGSPRSPKGSKKMEGQNSFLWE